LIKASMRTKLATEVTSSPSSRKTSITPSGLAIRSLIGTILTMVMMPGASSFT